MKNLRRFLLVKQSALVAILLGILGIQTSCNNRGAEYGCPSARFIIKGTVSSKNTGQAIQNIRISSGPYDSIFSDSNGSFAMSFTDFPSDTASFLLHFRDTDSTLNGSYKDLDTNIEFLYPLYTNGDGHWNKGETTKEVEIRLENK